MSINKIIKGSGGGGKGGGQPRQAVEDPDSLHSSQYAKIVDVISEGEIVGLADGHKSIYFDETPLMNENGDYNYNNVKTYSVFGTATQDYLPGFGSVSGETAVAIEVKKGVGAPPPKYIYQSDLDAVAVTLSINQLTTQNKENGDISGAKVDYKIQVEYDNSGNWLDVVDASFDGKTTAKYARQHRIELDKTLYNTQVAISVVRLTDHPEDSAINDAFYWDSYTKIIDNKLSYPNSALIGTQIDARQFTSIPKRAYHIRGIKCKVPTNYRGYDPDTLAVGDELYEGYWDGTFNKVSWTSNPAWIYYDIITNPRYGLGNYIQGTQIDKWALYQIARYCDAVDDDGKFVGVKTGFKDASGNNTYEPRFACNVYIQDQQEALKVIQDLAFAFRGLSYWANGQLIPVQDSPKEPTQLFTPANVIEGAFSYSGTSQKSRKTVALVSWNDPEDFYRRKIEYVEDRDGIQRYGIRKTDITSFGCTSRGQAHRTGLWTLFTDTLETETLSFKSGLEAAVLRPGELIKVTDPTRSGNRYGGRIKTGSTKINIILDHPLEVSPGSNYTFNVIHTENACLHPQESSPGVAHPHAGEMYTPSTPTDLTDPKEICISDGGQWSPHLFVENYPVTISEYPAFEVSLDTETSVANAGTGAPATPFSIHDDSMNFSDKYLNRSVTNVTTGATSVIVQVIASNEVHVADLNFATTADTIEYHHSLTEDPKSDYMWLLEETGVVDAQTWRVLGVKESKKNEYEVSALEYHEDKYRIIEEHLDFEELDERNISNIPNILNACPPPADLDIYETAYIGSDNSIRNKVLIQWQPPIDYPYIRQYSVDYRVNNGNWTDLGETEGTSIELLDAVAGDYEVRVRAQSIITNNLSQYVKYSKTMLGLAKPPSSITQYCSNDFTYARTVEECEGQGRCSTLDNSIVINDEATCVAQTPIDPSTGTSITTEVRCQELNHSWVENACKGAWISDGNNWLTDPTRFEIINDYNKGTSLTWSPISDLDLHYYELRKGVDWDTATPLIRDSSLSYASEGGYYLSTGNHKFFIKAKDNSGIYSNYVGEVEVDVTAPLPISNLSYTFAGTNVILTWDAPSSSFYAIKEYDVRYGSTWEENYAHRDHVNSNSISINVTWGGTRTYWVAPEDKADNYGTPETINIEIVNPEWTSNTVTHTLNNNGDAVLTWTIPDIGSLPITNYEIRYGGTSGDTATSIGTIKTTTHTENVTWGPTNGEPTRTFWIRAIDSAGNVSSWQSHDVEIRDPIDLKTLVYSLVGPDQVIDWTNQGAGDADYDNNIDYLLPVSYWEIKKGNVYGSATMLSPMKSSPRYSEKVDWGNGEFRRYWITPIDSAGNRGTNHSIDIVVNNPAIPSSVNYSVSGGTATISWNAPTADLDIVEYELRSGANWSTKLDGSANGAITKALTLNHTLNVDWRPYDPSNNIDDTRFFVRAIDSAGNYSEEPVHSVHTEGTGWVLAEIEQLGQVQNLSKSFVGIMVLLTWTAPTHAGDASNNYLPVDFYEIRDATGAVLKTTKSTSYSTPVVWSSSSPETFTIVVKDTAGNYGIPTNISVDIPKPDTVTGFNITVVDNNVLMKWNDATNPAKLDIDTYEIRRCPDSAPTCSSSTEAEWNSLVSISSTKGLFATHLETSGGLFKYWIRAKDSAGNLSDAVSSAANVSEPPDFVLQDEKVSTLDDSSAAAMKSYPTEETEIDTINLKKGPYFATLPVNLTETWQSHFTSNGYNSPQDQINAGHEYYLEPTLNSATIWQKWDLGTELDASSIQIIPTYRNLKGTISLDHTIYYLQESDASTYTSESISDTAVWTSSSGASTVSTHKFRYVKVKTVFTTDGGGNDLVALDEYKVKFSLKLITDAGTESILSSSGLCNSTASEDGPPFYWLDTVGKYGVVGANLQFDNDQTKCTAEGGHWYSTKNGLKVVRVFFAKDFKDIRSLNMNYAGELSGAPRVDRTTIFDFEDAPNPSFFYGFILDTDDGTGQEGKFSWTARGVQ